MRIIFKHNFDTSLRGELMHTTCMHNFLKNIIGATLSNISFILKFLELIHTTLTNNCEVQIFVK
jgi:hypothetical protein